MSSSNSADSSRLAQVLVSIPSTSNNQPQSDDVSSLKTLCIKDDNFPKSDVSKVVFRQRTKNKEAEPKVHEYRRLLKKVRPERPLSYIFQGAQSFSEMVKMSTIFADKSEFIREVFEHQRWKIIYFALPPGSGKTIMLTMVQAYVDDSSTVDENIFKSMEFDLKKTFKISEVNAEFEVKHLSRHPTLYFSLSEIRGNAEAVKKQISNEILQKMEEKNAELYRKYQDCLCEDLWNQALNSLTANLHMTSNSLTGQNSGEVVVLVDEFDAPVLNFHEINNDELKQITNVLQHFISALNKSSNVLIVLVNGTYPFNFGLSLKAHIISMDKNLSTTKKGIGLARFFGFEVEEFTEFCELYSIAKPLAMLAKEHFNGNVVANVELFNIWSVMRLLNDTEEGIISEETEDLPVYFQEREELFSLLRPIFTRINVIEAIQNLLANGEYSLKSSKPFQSNDFYALLQNANIIEKESPEKLKNDGIELLFKFLHLSGYLIRENESLKVPNEQYRCILKELVKDKWHASTYRYNLKFLTQITKDLYKIFYKRCENVDGLALAISNYLKETRLENDGLQRNEAYFQAFFSLAAFLIPHWTRGAPDHTIGGKGVGSKRKPDVVLSSRHRRVAMVVELKWSSKEDENSALGQIAHNGYITQPKAMREEAIERIIAIGIRVKEVGENIDDEINLKLEAQDRNPNESLLNFLKRFETYLKSIYDDPKKKKKTTYKNSPIRRLRTTRIRRNNN